MNERIKELAEQAAKKHGHTIKFTPEITETLDSFAELIVRECISTVENLSPGYQDYRNQIEDAFRRDCVAKILEHFGVKE